MLNSQFVRRRDEVFEIKRSAKDQARRRDPPRADKWCRLVSRISDYDDAEVRKLLDERSEHIARLSRRRKIRYEQVDRAFPQNRQRLRGVRDETYLVPLSPKHVFTTRSSSVWSSIRTPKGLRGIRRRVESARIDFSEDLSVTVMSKRHHLIGTSVGPFHPRRPRRHAWCRDACDVGPSSQQQFNLLGRDVTLDYIAVDDGSVAGRHACGDATILLRHHEFGRIHVSGVHYEARGLHVGDPTLAASAGRGLVDKNGREARVGNDGFPGVGRRFRVRAPGIENSDDGDNKETAHNQLVLSKIEHKH